MTRLLWVVLLAAAPAGASVPERAQQAMLQGQFERALRLLDAAVARSPDESAAAQLQLQRGLCLLVLRQRDRSEAALRAALLKDPLAAFGDGDGSPEARELLARVRERTTGKLEISSLEPGKVRVDDVDWGATPLTLELPVGEHAVQLWSSDGRQERKSVTVMFGRVISVELALPAAAPVPEPAPVARREDHEVEPLKVPQAWRPESEAGGVHLAQPSRTRVVPIALLVAGAALAVASVTGIVWSQGIFRRFDEGNRTGIGLVTRDEMRAAMWLNPGSIAAAALSAGLICWGAVDGLRSTEVQLTAQVGAAGGGVLVSGAF